jgi:hypothetical protein
MNDNRHTKSSQFTSPKSPSNARSAPPLLERTKHSSAPFIIGGLVIVQIVAALTIFTIFSPSSSAPVVVKESEVAFTIPTQVEAQPILPVQFSPETKVDLVEIDNPIVPVSIADLLQQTAASIATNSADLKIRGLEITQGIQVFNEPESPRCNSKVSHPDHIFCNNSMPLVAGRHTLLRLYLDCNDNCPTGDISVQLRVLKDGAEREVLTRQVSAATLAQVNGRPLEELRLNLGNSVNFEFLPPPDWMSGQIAFEIEAGSGQETQALLSTSQNFAVRKPLRVAYVPIQYQGVSPTEVPDIDHWLLRLYPVSEVEYFRLPVPDVIWDKELNKAEVLQELLTIYWLYTEQQPVEAWPDQLFGWLPQEYYNGGASDPDWCPNCAGPHSSRVAFGGLRPEQDIGGPRILVHEIAHNLGAKHAWSPTQQEDDQCFRAEGADIRVDPTWPYAETPYIQEIGIDLYSSPPIIYAPNVYDMMSYCTHPWVSPHTYRTIFESNLLEPSLDSSAAFQPENGAERGPALLISGIVYPDGTVSRPEIVQLDQAGQRQIPLTTSTRGDHCLDVYGFNNDRLGQYCFNAGFLDAETGLPTESSPYFFTLTNVDLADVARIELKKDQTSLITITPSANKPTVSLTFPNNGEVIRGRQTISWTAADADGEALIYSLMYSPDGGQSWLPLATHLTEPSYTLETSSLTTTAQALIRVIASDGFHTSAAQLAAPFIVEPGP